MNRVARAASFHSSAPITPSIVGGDASLTPNSLGISLTEALAPIKPAKARQMNLNMKERNRQEIRFLMPDPFQMDQRNLKTEVPFFRALSRQTGMNVVQSVLVIVEEHQ